MDYLELYNYIKNNKENDFNFEKIESAFYDMSFEDKMYFNYLLYKEIDIHSVYGINKYSVSNFRNCAPLTKDEKKSALDFKCLSRDFDGPWNYVNRGAFNSNFIHRQFAKKIEISAITKEDAAKIWKHLAPVLMEDKNCFKIGSKFDVKDDMEYGNFITIYTESDKQFLNLLNKLNKCLEEANLDINSFIDKTYINVGSSGNLSCVIDTDRNNVYIPRITNKYTYGRDVRIDLYNEMINFLKENNISTDSKEITVDKKDLTNEDLENINFKKESALDVLFLNFNVDIAFLSKLLEKLQGHEAFDCICEHFSIKDIINNLESNNTYFYIAEYIEENDIKFDDIKVELDKLFERNEFLAYKLSTIFDESKEYLDEKINAGHTFNFTEKDLTPSNFPYIAKMLKLKTLSLDINEIENSYLNNLNYHFKDELINFLNDNNFKVDKNNYTKEKIYKRYLNQEVPFEKCFNKYNTFNDLIEDLISKEIDTDTFILLVDKLEKEGQEIIIDYDAVNSLIKNNIYMPILFNGLRNLDEYDFYDSNILKLLNHYNAKNLLEESDVKAIYDDSNISKELKSYLEQNTGIKNNKENKDLNITK